MNARAKGCVRSRKFLLMLSLLSYLLFASPTIIDKARQLEGEGKYKEAILLYQEERRLRKNDSLYAAELFRLYITLKRIKEAKGELKKIPLAQRVPLLKFCEEKGLANLAREISQELKKSGFKSEEIYYNAARDYLKEGKIKEAVKKIAAIPQESAASHGSEASEKRLYYLAKFFFLAEEFDSCLKYTLEFSRRFPKSNLRNSLYELNLLATSGEEIKPLVRAHIFLEIGDNKKAEAELKRIASPYAKILLSQIYFAGKKTDLAIKLLEEVIFTDTIGFYASKGLLELAKIYQSLNNEQKMTTVLEELITRYPGSPFAPIARSRLKSERREGIH